MANDLNHKLQERIKELTALHKTARILQNELASINELFQQIVHLLPDAWQYPEIVSARIRCGDWNVTTPDFKESSIVQTGMFDVQDIHGVIEVFYLETRPLADEGPFLREERDLIESLAEMLRSFLHRKLAEDALKKSKNDLEKLVEKRTDQLRQLSQELCLAEAKERREIASDLHDHVGQALALIRLNVSQFRSNAVFCGFENQIGEILTLIDQTIRYARDLTCTISPPVLYELGLVAAFEWLCERTRRRFGLKASVGSSIRRIELPENLRVIIFKCVSELVVNVIKHAHAETVRILITHEPDRLNIDVIDDGVGFDQRMINGSIQMSDRFGLFSIRERLHVLGGEMRITSTEKAGTTVRLSIPIDRGLHNAN